MDDADRQVIDELFAKIAEVERRSPRRDLEADRLIAAQIARQPNAPYFLAQAVVALERALERAQDRLQELERQATQRSSGTFSSGAFGSRFEPGRRAPSPGHTPWSAGYRQPSYAYARGGSGFLAGAAQTAMGVAGGVLLGSLITDLLDGDDALAAGLPPGGDDSTAADSRSFADDGDPDDGRSYDDRSFDDGSCEGGGLDDFGGDF